MIFERDLPHEYIETKPEDKGTSPPEFAWRLERTRKAFKGSKFDYSPDDYITRRKDWIETQNQAFQREYGPSCVRKKLVRIMRIALPQANMFQFDDGKLDSKHSVKSVICYWVTCELLNEDALRRDGIQVLADHSAAQHTFQIGRIISPSIEPVYKDSKLNAYRIAAFNHVYFLEDSASAIKDIIKKYGKPLKEFSVAIARSQGPVYENDVTYVVFNDEDFIAADVKGKDRGQNILDLINANRKGFLGSKEKNGVERYLTTMKKLTDKGLTASEIDQLDVDELRSVLANKKKLVAATTK